MCFRRLDGETNCHTVNTHSAVSPNCWIRHHHQPVSGRTQRNDVNIGSLVGWLIGWELMALLTQIRLFCAFKVINYFGKKYFTEGNF